MFNWLETIFEIGLVIGVIYGLYYIANMFPNLGQAGRDATRYLDIGLAYMNNELGACGLGGNPSELSCVKDTDCTTSGICGPSCKCDPKKNTCYQGCKKATDCIQGRGITCDDKKCSGPRSFLPGGAFNSGCWIGWSALGALLGWLLLTGKAWTGMKWAGNKMVDGVKYVRGGKDYRQYRDSLDTLDKILDAQEGKNLSEWSAKEVARVHESIKTKIEQYNREVDQWNTDNPNNPFPKKRYTDKDIDWSALKGVKSIGITAGALAPEVLINNVLESFKERYNVSIRTVEEATENVTFKIPKILREIH